jgi:hypothetical protein
VENHTEKYGFANKRERERHTNNKNSQGEKKNHTRRRINDETKIKINVKRDRKDVTFFLKVQGDEHGVKMPLK